MGVGAIVRSGRLGVEVIMLILIIIIIILLLGRRGRKGFRGRLSRRLFPFRRAGGVDGDMLLLLRLWSL